MIGRMLGLLNVLHPRPRLPRAAADESPAAFRLPRGGGGGHPTSAAPVPTSELLGHAAYYAQCCLSTTPYGPVIEQIHDHISQFRDAAAQFKAYGD